MMVLPELSLLIFSITFLFLSLGKERGNLLKIARLGALGVVLAAIVTIGSYGEILYGAYRLDLFSQIFKIMIALGLFFVLLITDNKGDAPRGFRAEYFMFLGFSTLGLMMVVSSVELISLTLALEVSSFSLYVLVPLREAKTREQLEAAMKYLFFGAVSTGIMLYGMGYLYGLAQSTFLAEIALVIPDYLGEPVALVALLLIFAGFFFKLSLFPFHFWTPDIYEGSSNTTTTFIATVPKIAAAALLIRIASLASPEEIELTEVLIILAAFSMTLGNLAALVQRDLKRLLAYSGIAHAGYLLMGILTFTADGYVAVIYYTFVYLFMNLACFFVILKLAGDGENLSLDNLSGLARRAPLMALTLAAGAFGLAGIPPAGGFTGKFFIFVSAFQAGHLNIVIIGAVNTVLSIFYYLNLVRLSYSREAEGKEPLLLTRGEKTLCVVFIFIIIYLGILPYLPLGLFGLMV